MRKLNNGVYAMQTEAYQLPVQAEYTLQKTDRAWWASPPVIIALTVFLSLLDAAVLFDIMDAAMTQAAWLGVLVAIGIALVLNIIPLVIAKLIHQAIYKLKRYAGTMATLLLVAFMLLFSGTVFLRFAFSERYEPDNTGDTLINTMEETGQETVDPEVQAENEAQANAVVVLLSVEPLVTSTANFVLAFLSDDELRARINRLRVRRLELLESISDLQAARSNLESDRQKLLDLDEERYQAARQVLDDRCQILRTRARTLLAQYLADPSSISRLSAQSVALVEHHIPLTGPVEEPYVQKKEDTHYEIPA